MMIIFVNKTWHTWHTHSFTFIVFGHEGGMDPILDCWRDAPQVDTRARDYFTTITKRDVLCQVILVNFWTPFSLVTVALILHILRMLGGQGSNRGKLGRSSSSACICLSARWVRGGMSCFRQNMVCASGHWTWNKRVACLPVIYNLQVIHKMWIYDFCRFLWCFSFLQIYIAHLAKKKNAPRFSSFLFGVDCLSSLCFWVFPGRVTRFVGLQFPWISCAWRSLTGGFGRRSPWTGSPLLENLGNLILQVSILHIHGWFTTTHKLHRFLVMFSMLLIVI